MNNGRVFWGVLFLVLGALLLINNFVCINLGFWAMWKFWPVVLILIGIAWFTKNSRFGWTSFAVAAAVLAALLFATAQRGCNVVSVRHSSVSADARELSMSMDDTLGECKIEMNLGAGSFRMSDTTSQLILVRTETSFARYRLERDSSDGDKVVLSMEDADVSFGDNGVTNRADIQLNPMVLWDMNIEIGAASVNFDLSPYKLRNLQLSGGAASLRLRFGARYDTSRIKIDVGASSIVLLVPKNAGCEVHSNMELSSRHFEEFDEVGSDGDYRVFRSAGYDNASKKIYLTVDGGVSSIRIERYDEGKDF
jgi:hypothetical protein